MNHRLATATKPIKTPPHPGSAGRNLAVCFLLTLATVAAYWPVRHHAFVNFDDYDGIANNPHIRGGLSPSSMAWAFLNPHLGNWLPLTALSHMLDCQLFGLNAGAHHLVNLFWHSANTILLFLLLQHLTRRSWRSGFVAGLFALHPLHVESVAWVSERKDVLSTFFFLLTIWAYARYAVATKQSSQYSGSHSQRKKKAAWYSVAMGFFVCGLMSKPMLVTLPFVLLLLDFWPLARFDLNNEAWKLNTAWPLLREKLPFVALALVASVVTVITQLRSNAVAALADWPVYDRVANALLSYLHYIQKTFLPVGLIPYYPRVPAGPIWQGASAAVVLIVITVLVIRFASRRKHLVVGWLWFLGTLVPVIGLVQVGNQALADRYTYIANIGLFILVAWAVADLWEKLRLPDFVLSGLATITLAVCLALTRAQATYWQDTITLFKRVLAVKPYIALAHNNIGAALYDQGKFDEAISQLREALRLKPEYPDAHNNLGLCFWRTGHDEEAIAQFQAVLNQGPEPKAYYNLGVVLLNQGKLDPARECFIAALRLRPESAEARNNLGNVLAAQGRLSEAAEQFVAALRSDPSFAEAYCNLALCFANQNRFEEAVSTYLTALQKRPAYPEAHLALARLLEQMGRLPEAADHYAAAVQMQPGLAEAQNNLSNLAARMNDSQRALTHGLAAVQLKPDSAEAHYNLGNALFLQGELDDAVTQYTDALRLKTNYFEAHQNLGLALEKLGWDKLAVGQYEALVRMRPDFAAAYNRLAIVLAKLGRFAEAAKTADDGSRVATASGQSSLAEEMKSHLESYRASRSVPQERKQP